jgi:hypothetical protein
MARPAGRGFEPMASAPRDGRPVLARIRASEQGPAEFDVVRFAASERSGEEAWVANDSDALARVVYAENELSGWMPLPTQLPRLRSAAFLPPAAPGPAEPDEGDGSGV